MNMILSTQHKIFFENSGMWTQDKYAFKGIQKSAYYKVLWASRFPLIICNQRMFRNSKDGLEPISCMRQLSNGNPNVQPVFSDFTRALIENRRLINNRSLALPYACIFFFPKIHQNLKLLHILHYISFYHRIKTLIDFFYVQMEFKSKSIIQQQDIFLVKLIETTILSYANYYCTC